MCLHKTLNGSGRFIVIPYEVPEQCVKPFNTFMSDREICRERKRESSRKKQRGQERAMSK
jgi:hypothetical protein